MSTTTADDGRRRVIIEGVAPEIDGGRFPIKRTVGERVVVEADIFTDGHDAIACVLQYRKDDTGAWSEVAFAPLVNDRWRAEFTVTELGRYRYTISAWVDHFKSWRHDLAKRVQAEDIAVALSVGARIIEEAITRAPRPDAERLRIWANTLASGTLEDRRRLALDEELALLMARHPDRRFASTYPRELSVVVDRERARFSTWYEMFPRSCSPEPGRHGTFKDCEARLPYIAEMGFDVLYFPPIHPIGHTHRKGRNNALKVQPGDVGSPWAIGSEDGGHKAVHPGLCTLEDFQRLVARARDFGLEIALDIAFQCSPDHPYVKEHPEWFRHRPDGSIQYAENPPKKYQDIYPFDFETEAWQSLWEELLSVLLFWIAEGVHIFRVDNPHTKAFPFWEWAITEIKREHPDVIFLAEAFTRPKVMYRLAQLGFTQSYTYFAWRNAKWELTEYFTELTQVREYFRPNLWPNTPDILNEYLQHGGRPAFMVRVALAATLGASYGIYGPAFELSEHRARELGSEEYLDSEKYEIRHWDLARPDSLKDYIGRLNRIRYENPALQSDWNLRFYPVDNEQLIGYGKWSDDLSNVIVTVVNLDPHHVQSGWVELPIDTLGLDAHQPYQVHDLLTGDRYLWYGSRNYVEINPRAVPAHIFRVRRRLRTERDFEYFL
jgi:starch synthase (maltosyl-transferring)